MRTLYHYSVFVLSLVCLYFYNVECELPQALQPPNGFNNHLWAIKIKPTINKEDLLEQLKHHFSVVDSFNDVHLIQQLQHNSSLVLDSLSHKIEWLSVQEEVQFHSRDFRPPFPSYINDPLISLQWDLYNNGQFDGVPEVDVNIKGVWELGITGEGTVISIVDDGVQHQHPDLINKYLSYASWDFNENDNDPSPFNQGTNVTTYFHGTACAGVALADTNNMCGVGAAFNANLSAIRLIAGRVSDFLQSQALSYKRDLIDIYSCSWGPKDDGLRKEGPGPLLMQAIETGVNVGRGGKGNIFVFAAGNGAGVGDSCNYDGFVSNKYVISVGSIDHRGIASTYSEPCSSLLIVAPSSGENAGIVTTDIMGVQGWSSGNCNTEFGGTSSSAPLVSGIISLMIEQNRNLTYRDIQHILVATSRMTDEESSGWSVNGAGLFIHHQYGFGLVDAKSAVLLARNWTEVVPSVVIDSNTISVENDLMNGSPLPLISTFQVTPNENVPVQDLEIEHVEITVDIAHRNSGDLSIVLVSPSGTESILSSPHRLSQAIWSLTVASPQLNGGNPVSVPVNDPIWSLPLSTPNFPSTKITILPTDQCDFLNSNNKADLLALRGAIVLAKNTNCNLFDQVHAAQKLGAIAFISVDNGNKNPASVQITIPSLVIPPDYYSWLVKVLPYTNGNVNGTINNVALQGGYYNWTFTSVRNWGEKLFSNNRNNTWQLKVQDMGGSVYGGTFNSWSMKIYASEPFLSQYPPENPLFIDNYISALYARPSRLLIYATISFCAVSFIVVLIVFLVVKRRKNSQSKVRGEVEEPLLKLQE
eukprot:TRINITY_DN47_c0_g1_i1.p1 TRINITY_DN47_c0_g1~~TRINITY_DN47_c0_g1_i1.p1  ORF type:complete len:814 (-),score=144.84 TRINITY_DN47_c0_g1_i1:40-2481(-)